MNAEKLCFDTTDFHKRNCAMQLFLKDIFIHDYSTVVIFVYILQRFSKK